MFFCILLGYLTFAKPTDTGKHAATEKTLNNLKQALDLYYMDCGRFPSTEEGIAALKIPSRACERWGPDPYVHELPVDAWGYLFEYRRIGHGYELISRGRDGRLGGVGQDADLRLRIK